ncbi:MAG: dehydrogenase [Deltaproteobacteria bacterium]|nr:dehydrogenase [Deltaproteobacteria bacterium]
MSLVFSTYSNSKDQLDTDLLVSLYHKILLPRLFEEHMLLQLRKGVLTKWFSGIGQEAIAVGATAALSSAEYILPMHRNLGVFTTRDVPLDRLLAQFMGKSEGFTKGRDRSFHFGTQDFKIVGMISHLAAQLSVANGIALADKLSNRKHVTLAFTGEGATSEGEFHEALNVASVWNLPVIFLIENNYYGLSTPIYEQYKCDGLFERAAGYGIEGLQIDGNNILEVYHTISELASQIRNKPRPVLVECMTFRMRGHEEASGTKYVPEKLFEVWGQRDPVLNYEKFLLEQKVISEEDVVGLKEKFIDEIEAALELAINYPDLTVTEENEIGDVYAAYTYRSIDPASQNATEKRFVNAISDGLKQSLERHDNLIVMGQDIAKYGGVFKITEGFIEQFGEDRIRNTPICEEGILGAGLGLSINGYKSVIEMQFADFVSCGFNQIVNNLAKSHYRWGQNVDVVVRMPTGAGVRAGPFHSQSDEAWFTHVAGLKVVYPAFPADAKGLLVSSIDDPNPVLFFEHKKLYRSTSEEVYDDCYTVEIGKANLVRDGEDCTIISYGLGVHWALEYQQLHPEISIHILDLRTLLPLDYEAIISAVEKTGRVLVLHEDTFFGGIGGEIAAFISENCFESLDAPVIRCASLDTPVPFAAALEDQFLASSRLDQKILKLLQY